MRVIDLGSGGGVPGLVVAVDLPEAELVLLEANTRRASFLAEVVEKCDLGSRVQVVARRAEEVGRDPLWRGRFDGVTARSFGPPAVTAECAAPLLRKGGALVVSEPPAERGRSAADQETAPSRRNGGCVGDGSSERWPIAGLAALGMAANGPVSVGFTYQVVTQRHLCPDRFPRRNGVPAKRPLF